MLLLELLFGYVDEMYEEVAAVEEEVMFHAF